MLEVVEVVLEALELLDQVEQAVVEMGEQTHLLLQALMAQQIQAVAVAVRGLGLGLVLCLIQPHLAALES
jgi:hypothetical protein